MMFSRFTIVFVLFALVTAYTAVNAADGKINAETIYKKKCSYCHGIKGLGSATAPAFKGNEFMKQPFSEVKAVIVNGREKVVKRAEGQKLVKMPPWGGKLKDDEINALTDYIKSLY